MRTIDADALKEKAETVTLWNGDIRRFISYETIDNAPTVDPEITEKQAILLLINNGWLVNHDKELRERWERPQGKWIKETDEKLKGKYRCSECGRRVEDLTDDLRIHAGLEDSTISDIYPFCHCGADMWKGGRQ